MTDPSPAAGSKELRKKATRIFTGRVHRLPDRRVEIIQSKEMRNTKFIIAPYEQTLDKIERLIAAQNNATYEAVMAALPPSVEPDESLPIGVILRVLYVHAYHIGYDDGRGSDKPDSNHDKDHYVAEAFAGISAELRQSIAKIYGKDSTHAVTNEEQNHE